EERACSSSQSQKWRRSTSASEAIGETALGQTASFAETMMFIFMFGTPEDVTNPNQDGVQYSFPFTVVDSALVGAPEEKSQTQDRRVIVAMSRSRLVTWRLAKEDLIKVFFEYVK